MMFITSRTSMFNEATFQEILLPSSGRSISRNVASLNKFVHYVINLLYYEHWTSENIFAYNVFDVWKKSPGPPPSSPKSM